MKLYKLTRSDFVGYDNYDSAIVAAKDEVSALNIHPADNVYWNDNTEQWEHDRRHYVFQDWPHRDKIIPEYIGTAKPGTKAGVILASFNAG